MPVKDYYKTLGVDKSATSDEIKSAYRKLAKQYHPDLHPGDNAAAEKFKEVNEAYSVVGDPDKRAKYDRGEMDMDGAGGFNPFGGGGFTATGFDDIFDMFSDAFGFGGSSRRRRADQSSVGSDITYSVNLTFMESILGCSKTITYNRIEKCPTCGGTGAKDENHMHTCDKCGGSGQVRRVQNSFFGQQVTIGVCDKCGGSGKIVTENCKTCNGKGVVNGSRKIDVTFSAGVSHGSVHTLAGEGNAARGKGGRYGNLILEVSVKPSAVFKREGLNLYVTVPVTFITAVCGGEIEIPAPDGVFIHRLSEGTTNGEQLRFRGKGIRTTRGIGDLFATINVEVPKGVTRSQKKALEQFEKECTIKNYSQKRAYLDEIAKLYDK